MRLLGILIFTCLLPFPAWASDQFYIGARGGIDLVDEPKTQAKVITHLPRMSDVQFVRNQRAWTKVRAVYEQATVEGWVPAGAVRKRYNAQAAKSASTGFFSGFSSLFHRDETAHSKTAVLGVRGFENEAGGKTTTDEAQQAMSISQNAAWVESLQVSDQDVSAFIKQGDLNP